MTHFLRSAIVALPGIIGICCAAVLAEQPLNFNRDVRPILSDKCFACHGQDSNKRQADLRLDVPPDPATKVIVANKPDKAAWSRASNRATPTRLCRPQKPQATQRCRAATLRRWIEKVRSTKNTGPLFHRSVRDATGKHPVDYLIRKVFQANGLDFSPEAAHRNLAAPRDARS